MIRIETAGEPETLRLAEDLASLLMPGDCLAFSGDLGAGKSFLIRAMLRFLARDEALEVPSPTFTLVQSYALERFTAHHADLYRLADADEVVELGLFDDEGAVALVEWAEKAGDYLPADRLEIAMEISGESGRSLTLRATGAQWGERLSRLEDRRAFLETAGAMPAVRHAMQGDCSTRIYTRLSLPDGESAILMDAPAKADPGLGRLAYSRIAHLAEDMVPFVAVDEALRTRGFSAPAILARNVEKGFLLLEDFGGEGVLGERRKPLLERYQAGVDCLVALHRHEWPKRLPAGEGLHHDLPPYDVDAMLAEVSLFLDWYCPHMGLSPDQEARQAFMDIWRGEAEDLQTMPRTIVLRDFHSPNIMWLERRDGIARVGLIDFQDALLGPAAYDLVSATQDARVFMPESLERSLLSRYLEARSEEEGFDPLAFHKSYRVMGAQRATKVLGIFARLAKRDGKSQHLDKLPIVRDYLGRNLRHESLAPLARWHAEHAPILEPA